MTPSKSVLKFFDTGDVQVEWFTYSSSYANTPDYVTFTKGKVIDTLCISTNIADIQKGDDSVITISFYGVPKKYSEVTQWPERVFGYTIVIDTTYNVRKVSPK
jgi:hypothetical protein